MKNTFDDIVRKKWEEKQFPIDDAHRQDMIRLLDQQPRRRTAIFWWFGAAGIIISVASAFLFLNTKDIPQQPVAPGGEIQNTTPTQTLQPSGSIAGTTDISANENEMASTVITSASETISNSSAAIRSEKKSNKAVTNPAKAITNNRKRDQPTQTSAIPVASIPNGATFSSNAKIVEPSIPTNLTDPASEEKISGNTVESTTEMFATNAANVTRSSEPIIPAENGVESRNSFSTTPAEVVVSSRNSFSTSPVEDLLFTFIPVDERVPDQNAAPVIAKRHPIAFYAEAAAGYVPAPTRLISAGSSVRAGAGVNYGLASGLQVSVTGGYMLQKDGFEFQKTSTSSFPGFGARSNFHTLTPDKLHFVYARVGINKRLHRHIFSIFGGTQYLYGAQGNIVIQTQDQLTGESETSKYAWLKLDGMQRWLWNTEATYGYQITPRLSAHAGVRYYFSKISSDPVEGYYLEGKLTNASPFLTLNYHLYGTR